MQRKGRFALRDDGDAIRKSQFSIHVIFAAAAVEGFVVAGHPRGVGGADQLTKAGFVRKQKMGKTNFYINEPLFALLSGVTLEQP